MNEPERRKENKRALREGNLIKVIGSGISFRIPQYWVKWYEENNDKPNIHLTDTELSLVKEAKGEWDEEFASVVNFTLPFEQCIAHVGREGWGSKGISYTDLQVRIYILPDPPEIVAKRAVAKGALAVEEITGKSFVPQVQKSGNWEQIVLEYLRFYQDYGAKAIIDLRFRQFNSLILLFAFMYTDHQDVSGEIEMILKSVKKVPVKKG